MMIVSRSAWFFQFIVILILADGSTGSRTDPTNSGDPKAKVAAAKAQIETCMGCPTRVQDCLHLTGIEH